MVGKDTKKGSPEASALQGGERIASITPTGAALNRSMTEEQRVKATEKSEGWTGHDGSPDYTPPGDPDTAGGFGILDESQRPAARDHTRASGDGHDSQYGASPIRRSRYIEGEGTDAMVDSVPETPPGVPRRTPNPD